MVREMSKVGKDKGKGMREGKRKEGRETRKECVRTERR